MTLIHDLLGGLNGKTILAFVGNVAAAAQHFRSLIDGLIQQVRIGLEADAVFIRARINFPEGAVGDEHAAVFIVLAKHSFGLFHHADHTKRRAINHHIFAQRRNIGKKDRRGIFPEHYHFFAVQIVTFADESAFQRRGVGINLAEIRLYAAEIDGGDFAVLGAHGMLLLPPGDENGEVLDRGT